MNYTALAVAVSAIEDGMGFDEFENKFQEHYASQTTLPAITFYNLADWVVNTYRPAVIENVTKSMQETCDEESKEEHPQIRQISVRHRMDVPGGPYVDDIIGTDLSLNIHDGYVDILDTDGKRYLGREDDISNIVCFPVPAKKEEKDG